MGFWGPSILPKVDSLGECLVKERFDSPKWSSKFSESLRVYGSKIGRWKRWILRDLPKGRVSESGFFCSHHFFVLSRNGSRKASWAGCERSRDEEPCTPKEVQVKSQPLDPECQCVSRICIYIYIRNYFNTRRNEEKWKRTFRACLIYALHTSLQMVEFNRNGGISQVP